MSSLLRVAYTKTWDPIEVAGGSYQYENGSTVHFHGSGIQSLKEILNSLQEKIVIGNYYEAIKMVANNSADIGALTSSHESLFIQFGLGTNLSFAHPLDKEASFVFFRQPLSESLRITMLRSYTTAAWSVFLAIYIIVAFILDSQTLLKFRFQNILRLPLNTVAIIVGCPAMISDSVSVGAWRRIIILVVSLLRVITLSVYTAKIVSVFSLKDELVKSPEDLQKFGYEFYSYSPLHIDRIFNDNKTRQLVRSQAEKIWDFDPIASVVGKHVKDPRQALFSHPDGFYPQALFPLQYNEELCLVTYFKSIRQTPRSLYIRKDSIYREKINVKILHLLERGLNFRHLSIFKAKYQFHCPNRAGNFSPLSLQHTSLAFFVLLIGSVLAVMLNCASYLKFKFDHLMFWKFQSC